MEKSKFKKPALIVMFVVDIFIVLPIILYFLLVPRNEIEMLENNYVSVKLDKENKASFNVVKKMPKDWVSMRQMNYTAIHAVVVSEDWAFYEHSGYDLRQIQNATSEAINGERTRGASTISQQVIKNIFLTPEKTLSRKVKELIYSITMERSVSKQKILEIYLNIAEFGDGIYGIKQASQHYFKKDPKNLSAREGAFLAMLLPSPKRYSQSFRDKKMSEFATKTVEDILKKMEVANYINDDQLEKAANSSFDWQLNKESSTKLKSSDESDDQNATSSESQNSKNTSGLKKAMRKKKDLSGKNEQARYRADDELELEENPEFDDDAIIEDIDGIEQEFNVQ